MQEPANKKKAASKAASKALKAAFNEIPEEMGRKFVQAAVNGDTITVLELLDKYGSALFYERRITSDTGAMTALGFAARYGRLEMIELLLEKGSPITERSKGGRTPAFHANLEAVKLLVEKGLDINAQDKRGWTALMCEAINGDIGRVKFLLELGASIELTNNEGLDAVSLARGDGDFHVAKFIKKWELDREIADFSPGLKRAVPVPRPLKKGV